MMSWDDFKRTQTQGAAFKIQAQDLQEKLSHTISQLDLYAKRHNCSAPKDHVLPQNPDLTSRLKLERWSAPSTSDKFPAAGSTAAQDVAWLGNLGNQSIINGREPAEYLLKTQGLDSTRYAEKVQTSATTTSAEDAAQTAASTFEPMAHMNAWLGSIGTAVGTVSAIFKAMQPVYNFGAPGSSGIGQDDLVVAFQAGLLKNEQNVWMLPLAYGTRVQDQLSQVRKQMADLDARLKSAQQLCASGDSAGASELQGYVDQVSAFEKKLNDIYSATSSGDMPLVAMESAVALDDFAGSDPTGMYLIEMSLSDSSATSATDSHWWGPIDQLLQTTLLARYRIVNISGHLVGAGTMAVYCQTKIRIGKDASTLMPSLAAPKSTSSGAAGNKQNGEAVVGDDSYDDMAIFSTDPSRKISDGSTPRCVAKEVLFRGNHS